MIDADTHVVESEATWSFFDEEPSLARWRPALVPTVDGATSARVNRWLIDGRVVPKPEGRGGASLGTPPADEAKSAEHYGVRWELRSLADPIGRVKDAERYGVTRQVLYPTIFLSHLSDDPIVNSALCRSYNRFMARAWEAAGGRFSWVLVPPLYSISDAVDEIRLGRRGGAVGVMFRGLECDRSLGDPYFEPVYDAAAQEGLPVCIHTGPGCKTLLEMADNRRFFNFGQNRVLPLVAFHDLVFNKVPQRFPTLRFGFIESTASWVPFLLHFLGRQARQAGRDGDELRQPSFFEENRLFVACEADEDVPYLVQRVGPHNLLIGSDYGHADQSAELAALERLVQREDVDVGVASQIVEDNPRRFYGLPEHAAGTASTGEALTAPR